MMALSAHRPTRRQLPTGKLLQLCAVWLCLCVFTPSLLATPNIAFEVVARYPHRSTAFTQGLELIGDTLYESSGLYGKSFVARWQLRDEAPIATRRIAPEYFAEGLTFLAKIGNRTQDLHVTSIFSGLKLLNYCLFITKGGVLVNYQALSRILTPFQVVSLHISLHMAFPVKGDKYFFYFYGRNPN